MKVEKTPVKTGLSRRSFLQWAGALSTTAALYGCSSGDSDDAVLTVRDDLVFDHTVQQINTGHLSHCGAQCMLKLHVKNGKLLKITSGGDISAEQEKANAARLINANGSTRDEKAGIVPGVWCQSDAADESMGPIQRRACMKGLSEAKMVYAPDRLKYPLMQTGERGNLKTFKRITWEKAYEEIKGMFEEMEKLKETEQLPYLPIYDGSNIGRYMGHYTVSTYGASSTGGVNDGYWAALGVYDRSNCNPALDMLNAEQIITWSNDLRSNRNTWPFYLQKAKDLGIPILDINAYHTDTGAASGWNPDEKIDGVPPYITTNAGTDSCFETALAYVIFKNELYDDDFLEDHAFAWAPVGYPKKASSSIITNRNKTTREVFDEMAALKSTGGTTATHSRQRPVDASTWEKGINPNFNPNLAASGEWHTNELYESAAANHNTVTIAEEAKIGDSFVEYLISLEHTWGGAEFPLYWCTGDNYWEYAGPTEDELYADPSRLDDYQHPGPDYKASHGTYPARHKRRFPAEVDSEIYWNVLRHAEKITGVKAKTIENIAKKMAAKRTFIISFYSGGASRAQNGMYHTWMMIALQAMCGWLNQRGGGTSEMEMGDGHVVKLGDSPLKKVNPSTAGTGTFPILNWCLADTILSGHDSRTISELKADTMTITNGDVDLGTTGATIKMFYRGSGHTSPLQQQPDMTKNLKVFKDKNYMKHIVVQELFMNPLAAIADIVLPAGHYFEQSSLTNNYTHDMLMTGAQGTLKPLYDTKPDQHILDELINYCGYEKNSNVENLSDEEVMMEMWEKAKIPDSYQPILNSAPATSPKELPTYEKMKAEANLQLVVPLADLKSKIEDIEPGKFWSQTGYVQFMSPWLKKFESERDTGLCIRGGWRAGYHQLDEGYERLLDYSDETPIGRPGTGMPGLKRKNTSGGTLRENNGIREVVFTDESIDNRVRYPLQLGTPHLIQRSHAHWDSIPVLKDENPHVVRMHPNTALMRGIEDGDMVYVYNDNGCIKLPAMITRRVKPQSIIIGQGAWYRASTTETYKAFFRNAKPGVDEYFRQGSDFAAPLIDDPQNPGQKIPDPDRKGHGGEVVMWEVPVDVGGAINSLCLGRNCGVGTPLISGSVALPTVGMLCEVSKVHPDAN